MAVGSYSRVVGYADHLTHYLTQLLTETSVSDSLNQQRELRHAMQSNGLGKSGIQTAVLVHF